MRDLTLTQELRAHGYGFLPFSDNATRRWARAIAAKAGFKVRTHRVPDGRLIVYRDDYTEEELRHLDAAAAQAVEERIFGPHTGEKP